MDDRHVIEVREIGRIPLRLLVAQQLPLGRDCEGLLLSDDRVSRSHAEFSVSEGQLTVRDLDSRNGTSVNDRPITGPVALSPGDVVRLGDTEIWVAPDIAPQQQTRRDPTRATMAADDIRSSIVQLAEHTDTGDTDQLRASVVSGSLTIVFTDIADSTAITERVGDQRWIEILRGHNDIVLTHLDRYSGAAIKERGDGYMLTFPGARHAILFAISVQREMDKLARTTTDWPVRVRIGVHVGEAVKHGGDLFGWHVNLAARIADQAAEEEILVSGMAHELASSMRDIPFGEPRELALKGLTGTHVTYPVQWR